MRRNWVLTLVLFFGSAVLFAAFLVSYRTLFFLPNGHDEAAKQFENFERTAIPNSYLNLTELYQGPGQAQILHSLLHLKPLQVLQTTRSCEVGSPASSKTSGSRCEPVAKGSKLEQAAILKEKTFQSILQGRAIMPLDFLRTPPFLNAQGKSYAYLLATSGLFPFNQPEWAEQHFADLKLPELRELMTLHRIKDSYFTLLAELSDSEAEMLVRGTPAVLTRKFLFIRDKSQYGFSPLAYWVHDIANVEEKLAVENYAVVPAGVGTSCIYQVGNACWTYQADFILGYLQRYSMAVVALLLLFFLGAAIFAMKRWYEKSKEQQKHRLALQVLSHEFRTPVSSLLLLVDQLSVAAASKPQTEQDLIVRLESEAFRLQRIVETSKNYLQAHGRRLYSSEVLLPSLNEWVADFVEELKLPVIFKASPQDLPVKVDPFWLKFVLSNLVQNAFAHGAEPVFMRIEVTKKSWQIVVQDSGHCAFNSFAEMAEPFQRCPQSKGMGLGLNIVNYVVEELGGKIKFQKAPTEFSVDFRSL